MLSRQHQNLVHRGRPAGEMDHGDRLGLRGDGARDSLWIQIKIFPHIGKADGSTGEGNGAGAGQIRVGGSDHLVPRSDP